MRDDDLAVMAREAVRSLAAVGRWNEPAIPREWRERLLSLSALGSVGAIGDDHLSDAWSFLRRFSDVGTEQGRPGEPAREAARIARYAALVALPRLETRPLDLAEDIAHLASLA